MDFIAPRCEPALLKAMRSAACYAELAQLSSSWEPYAIEFHVYNRKHNEVDFKKSRATFYPARNGSVPPPSRVKDVETKFPHTRLRWWHAHPIASILCNARLEQDGVLKALGTCPAGDERQHMWDETCVGMASWERFRVEVADSLETIASLAQIGSVESLLVLIGRMRLAQLRGRSELDMAYECAVWKTLPTCIARSPHLLFGSEALLAALDGFLSWSPFSDSRFLGQIADKRAVELRLSFYARLAQEMKRLDVQTPPEEHLSIRKRIVADILTKGTKPPVRRRKRATGT